MAKLADAADLKSAGAKALWGFDSPSRHQNIADFRSADAEDEARRPVMAGSTIPEEAASSRIRLFATVEP